jgi:hypothetical protein
VFPKIVVGFFACVLFSSGIYLFICQWFSLNTQQQVEGKKRGLAFCYNFLSQKNNKFQIDAKITV